MNGTEFAKGLRAIAAWYDEHPDAPVPYLRRLSIASTEDSIEQARSLARMLGSATKEFGLSTFSLVRNFDGVDLEFIFWRSVVCTRRVTGTRTVPAKPAEPERVEEIFEWDCEPILAGEDRA